MWCRPNIDVMVATLQHLPQCSTCAKHPASCAAATVYGFLCERFTLPHQSVLPDRAVSYPQQARLPQAPARPGSVEAQAKGRLKQCLHLADLAPPPLAGQPFLAAAAAVRQLPAAAAAHPSCPKQQQASALAAAAVAL